MKYAPDAQGRFAGQQGYGYRSFEAFVRAVASIRTGDAVAADFDSVNTGLPTVHNGAAVTAILDAGRRSLDAGGAPMRLLYAEEDEAWQKGTTVGKEPSPVTPTGIEAGVAAALTARAAGHTGAAGKGSPSPASKKQRKK